MAKKVVKLASVLKMLRDAAEKANQDASQCVGVDNDADCYYQGLRNGYTKSAQLLEEQADRLE